MTNHLFRPTLLGLALSAVLTATSGTALAFDNQPSEAELEDFRERLDDYFSDVIANAEVLAPADTDAITSLIEGQDAVEAMDAEQLETVMQAFDANPQAWKLPEVMHAMVERRAKANAPKTASGYDDVVAMAVPGLEEGKSDDDCDFMVPIEAEIPVGTVSMALDAASALIAPGLVVVAAGNGTTTPNPLKIAAVAAAHAGKLVWQAMKWDRQVSIECKNANHRQFVYDIMGPTQAHYTPKKEIKLTASELASTPNVPNRGEIEYGFIIQGTEDGKLADFTIDKVKYATKDTPSQFAAPLGFSIEDLGAGLQYLRIRVDGTWTKVRQIQLEVSDSHTYQSPGDVVHYGTLLFDLK